MSLDDQTATAEMLQLRAEAAEAEVKRMYDEVIPKYRAEIERVRAALQEAVDAARLFNRSGMTWLEYDALLVRLDGYQFKKAECPDPDAA